ncbi:MAG: hypothetical protein WC523_03995 [Patescibacteria group bacterium]
MKIGFDKEDIEGIFILWLSGIAKMKDDKEIVCDIDGVEYATFEFPTKSPNYVICRAYYRDGKKRWEYEYRDGLQHGWAKGWDMSGRKWYKYKYKDGRTVTPNVWRNK